MQEFTGIADFMIRECKNGLHLIMLLYILGSFGLTSEDRDDIKYSKLFISVTNIILIPLALIPYTVYLHFHGFQSNNEGLIVNIILFTLILMSVTDIMLYNNIFSKIKNKTTIQGILVAIIMLTIIVLSIYCQVYYAKFIPKEPNTFEVWAR